MQNCNSHRTADIGIRNKEEMWCATVILDPSPSVLLTNDVECLGRRVSYYNNSKFDLDISHKIQLRARWIIF